MENFGDGTDDRYIRTRTSIIILSHLLLPDEFPVASPIKHGRNYFVRRLHYAAGEVRSYTLYFPMHRNQLVPQGELQHRRSVMPSNRVLALQSETA